LLSSKVETIAVSGNLAFTASVRMFYVSDITNPTRPRILGSISFQEEYYPIRGIKTLGHYAYLARGRELVVVDISNPTRPGIVSQTQLVTSGGSLESIDIAGNYAYLLDMYKFHVIDISNPIRPIEVGFLDGPNYGWLVTVKDQYAYINYFSNGLEILDISNPENPVLAGKYLTSELIASQIFSIQIQGNYAFILIAEDGITNYHILDITNRSNPQLIKRIETGGFARDMVVLGGFIYEVNYDYGTLRIYSIEDPTNPILVSSDNIFGVTSGVIATDNLVFVAAGKGGLIINRRPTTLGTDLVLQSSPRIGAPPEGIARIPVYYENFGFITATETTLQATLDPNLTYINDTSGLAPSISGNIITWAIGDLPLYGRHKFDLAVQLPDVPIGTLFTADLNINFMGDDYNESNNHARVQVISSHQLFLPVSRNKY
jgi:hypothetical protein